MMKAAITFERSVKLYQTTRRNISEDGHLDDLRHEDMKCRRYKLLAGNWRADTHFPRV
jgi:hypothetical protein